MRKEIEGRQLGKREERGRGGNKINEGRGRKEE